jgi:hypothetical protein
MSDRKETYNLNATNKRKANSIINNILHNNKYDMPLLSKLTITEKKKKMNTPNTKWSTFSCAGKETKFITKLLKKYYP